MVKKINQSKIKRSLGGKPEIPNKANYPSATSAVTQYSIYLSNIQYSAEFKVYLLNCNTLK